MRNYAVTAAVALLGACQTTQPAVEVREVPVPTPVACVPADTLADLEAAVPPRVADQLTGNAALDLPIVAGSALELRAWVQDALAVLRECGE